MLRLLSVILMLLPIVLGCGDRPPASDAPGTDGRRTDVGVVRLSGPTMGTRYTVKVDRLPGRLSQPDLREEIESTLARIDRRMSTWRDDSELSRFNASRSTDWFPVSDETARVVAEALRVGRLTGGAFDVTVVPLLGLWGFGPKGRPRQVPSEAEIAAAQRLVDYEKIDVRHDPPALRKERAEMEIVLAAIAKGFAVDRLAGMLEEVGVGGYMVEIGGDLRVRGRRPDGSAWRIGIERPTPGSRRVQRVLALSDRAMATSGDYRNYFEQDGRRYSHEIDPRTGRPIAHRLASVTVLAESCMAADAMATALMVLGPEAGYNLAVREDLAAYFIVRGDERFVERTTPRFAELSAAERHEAP